MEDNMLKFYTSIYDSYYTQEFEILNLNSYDGTELRLKLINAARVYRTIE
jgi:hypothetical protein